MKDSTYMVRIDKRLVCSCQPDHMKLVTVLDDLSITPGADLDLPDMCNHVVLAERGNIAKDLGKCDQH